MPARRAAEIRAALEDALGTAVDAFPSPRGIRISAPAPASDDWDRWRKTIEALRDADAWGSSDTGEGPQIWATVEDGVSP
ncbi:hypothetical protein [Streptomyces sp. NPDC096132]|uniref:hypothetical protein n=1 Tax=Streptomyces sp. NPDC096132 TaxID=3366075 RepID=UPI0038283F7B